MATRCICRQSLGDRESWDRPEDGQVTVPASLAFAIGDQLAVLPEETRSLLQMLAVVNARLPLALLGEAAAVTSPSAVIEPAVKAGLVAWSSHEPTAPASIRHALQRDADHGSLAAGKRRELHARAVNLVDETSAWHHRVAALDQPDEELAGRLERLAVDEAGRGRLPIAATHLLWASDISTQRGHRERRLLTAVLHLMLADEARGLTLPRCGRTLRRVTAARLRAWHHGVRLRSTHRSRDAIQRRPEPGPEGPRGSTTAALAANRLAGTYTLLGAGKKVMALGRWALDTGCLDAAAHSQTRTLIAIGASQVGGPRRALTELDHLESDPARVERVHADGLSFRGVFQLLAGNLSEGVADLVASIRLVRHGATFTLGVRAYPYLALGQYLAGAWDDALLTSEQGFSAAAVHPRRFELPLLHLAASCVPTGRGATEESEYHIRMAEEAAATVDYGQERLYAAMAGPSPTRRRPTTTAWRRPWSTGTTKEPSTTALAPTACSGGHYWSRA